MTIGHSMSNRDPRGGALCAVIALGGLFMSAAVARPASGETVPIPLVPALTIVAAVVQGGVDIEGLRTIKSVDADGIVIAFSWTTQDQAAKAVEDFAVTRIVRRE